MLAHSGRTPPGSTKLFVTRHLRCSFRFPDRFPSGMSRRRGLPASGSDTSSFPGSDHRARLLYPEPGREACGSLLPRLVYRCNRERHPSPYWCRHQIWSASGNLFRRRTPPFLPLCSPWRGRRSIFFFSMVVSTSLAIHPIFCYADFAHRSLWCFILIAAERNYTAARYL